MKDNDTKLYRCDPDKYLDCSKRNCYRNGGPCMHVTNKKYKMNIFKRVKEWFIYGIMDKKSK